MACFEKKYIQNYNFIQIYNSVYIFINNFPYSQIRWYPFKDEADPSMGTLFLIDFIPSWENVSCTL